MILVYPPARGSLMICRASVRAASTEPRKIVVIAGRFDFLVLKGGPSVVLLLKSLSTVAVDGDPREAANFPSSPVLVIGVPMCLLPDPCFCMFLSSLGSKREDAVATGNLHRSLEPE